MALEDVIRKEYPELVHNHDIAIKISGCPNSCGQHGIAGIGFHGSSLKKGSIVVPALQVLLGGSIKGGGDGAIAKKVIKIPSKKGPDALRWLLNDYETHGLEGEYFAAYVERQGEMYFYHLLKPLTHLDALTAEDYIDWGSEKPFEVLKAVGECAGVIIDLVSTLLYEAEEKAGWAADAFREGKFADSVYHSYNALLSTAKALLLDRQVTVSTQDKVLKAFDEQFEGTRLWPEGITFEAWVLRMNSQAPGQFFAEAYLADALQFVEAAKKFRNEALAPKQEA
jgi:sulfite reductase (ferredoxin)